MSKLYIKLNLFNRITIKEKKKKEYVMSVHKVSTYRVVRIAQGEHKLSAIYIKVPSVSLSDLYTNFCDKVTRSLHKWKGKI